MQLEDYFDFFTPNDIRLKGTRVGIETILYDHIHRARTPEQIVAEYPSLSLEQVYATILYRLHYREAVDAYLTEWLEWGNRMRLAQAHDPAHQEWLARLRAARDERRRTEAFAGVAGAE
jgi:uncharacterized protein (DUF433 family)